MFWLEEGVNGIITERLLGRGGVWKRMGGG